MVIERSSVNTEVVAFENPNQALEYLHEAQGDMDSWLIFLDINMPEMDGWEFADQYSAFHVASSNVLVMLTSSIDPRDEERAKKHAVICDYRTKPLTFEILDDLRATYFS
jgi:CheY-like chemotaxis protein